jgi:hypothetical protein
VFAWGIMEDIPRNCAVMISRPCPRFEAGTCGTATLIGCWWRVGLTW